MPSLYVTEPRAVVRRSADCLQVTLDGVGADPVRREILLQAPPHHLELIALLGDVHITGEATRFCLERGIAVAWFGAGGRLLGRLVPETSRSGDLRLLQYAAWTDETRRLELARHTVAAKLSNAAGGLSDLRRNYPDQPLWPEAEHALRELSRRAVGASRASLLGLEGLGAHRYFEALTHAFRGDIGFDGRRQYPPPDPANALLSFAYALLGNQLAGLLEARGLDPTIGYYHEVRPGRPSLALDLLEEFRHPVADRFVLRVCNLRMMRPEMFQPDADRSGGVRLGRDGQRLFFTEWERFLLRPLRERDGEAKAVRPLLRRQVERLVAHLRGGAAYRPLNCGP
jgi:CRISPR-associated protein Cas1